MTESNIRILLVDDHPLFRRGLSFLLVGFLRLVLRPLLFLFVFALRELEVLGYCFRLSFHRPDLVLLDVEMPVMNGPEALAQMLDFQPGLPVLMLTISEDADNLKKCLELGARGYILKNADTDLLVGAIR